MGPATREYLTALVAFTLLILFMAIGAAVGVSIVPYWVGGWEFVIKVWKLNGAPVAAEWYTKVLVVIGILAGFALGYVVTRIVWYITGLMSHEEIRETDRDLLNLIKHGGRPAPTKASKQP